MESDISVEKEKSQGKVNRFETIKSKRVETMALVKRTVDQCNELIATENKLFSELKDFREGTAAMEQRLQSAKSSLAECADTMSLYGTFNEKNQNYIETISSYYNAQWESFESKCFEWSAHELVVHFRRIAASVAANGKDSDVDEQSSDYILSLFSLHNLFGSNRLLFFSSLRATTERIMGIGGTEIE